VQLQRAVSGTLDLTNTQKSVIMTSKTSSYPCGWKITDSSLKKGYTYSGDTSGAGYVTVGGTYTIEIKATSGSSSQGALKIVWAGATSSTSYIVCLCTKAGEALYNSSGQYYTMSRCTGAELKSGVSVSGLTWSNFATESSPSDSQQTYGAIYVVATGGVQTQNRVATHNLWYEMRSMISGTAQTWTASTRS